MSESRKRDDDLTIRRDLSHEELRMSARMAPRTMLGIGARVRMRARADLGLAVASIFLSLPAFSGTASAQCPNPALPGQAQAQCSNADVKTLSICEDRIPGPRMKLLRKLYPKAAADDGGLTVKGDFISRIDPAQTQCMLVPARPDLALLAVPMIELNPESVDKNKGDVELFVLEAASGMPLTRRLETGLASSDAMRFGALIAFSDVTEVKTGNIGPRPDLPVLGLQAMRSGRFRSDPLEFVLSLYSFDGRTMTPLVKGLIVYMEKRKAKEGIGISCDGSRDTFKRFLSFGGSSDKIHPDILIDEVRIPYVQKPDKDPTKNCIDTQMSPLAVSYVLHFDGERYRKLNEGRTADDLFDE